MPNTWSLHHSFPDHQKNIDFNVRRGNAEVDHLFNCIAFVNHLKFQNSPTPIFSQISIPLSSARTICHHMLIHHHFSHTVLPYCWLKIHNFCLLLLLHPPTLLPTSTKSYSRKFFHKHIQKIQATHQINHPHRIY